MKLMSAIIILGFGVFQFKTCTKVKKKEKADCTVKEQNCSAELALGGPINRFPTSSEKKKV
jgi:hypothetical protein